MAMESQYQSEFDRATPVTASVLLQSGECLLLLVQDRLFNQESKIGDRMSTRTRSDE